MSAGAVVWMTGLPSSGKSTLARRLRARLLARGRPAVLLDGDELRDALVPRPGYDAESRADFYATVARMAALFARQGLVAIVAATAHRRDFRDRARELAPRFVEVHLAVELAECAERDDKQLYARARAGEPLPLPGASLEYQPPISPEVVASGGHDERALDAIVALLGSSQNA